MSEREAQPTWRKSSYSQDGDCVECNFSGIIVDVRDSKDPDGPTLRFGYHEWCAFIAGVKSGEIDLIAKGC
jgi:Domain of unknown function (DUF397)